MESFKYNVFESESLFSEFYHSRHSFFTRVSPFNALPGYVPDIIQFHNYYPIKVQIRNLRMVTVASDFLSMLNENGRLKSSKMNKSMKKLEQLPPMAIFVFSGTISAQETCLKKNVNHVHHWKWKVTSTTLVATQVLSQVCINLVLNVLNVRFILSIASFQVVYEKLLVNF